MAPPYTVRCIEGGSARMDDGPMSSEQDPAGRRLRSSRRAPMVIRGASSAPAGTEADGPAWFASYCEETHVVAIDGGSTGVRDPAAASQVNCATLAMVELDGAVAGSAEAVNSVVCLPAPRHAAATRGADATGAMTSAA